MTSWTNTAADLEHISRRFMPESTDLDFICRRKEVARDPKPDYWGRFS